MFLKYGDSTPKKSYSDDVCLICGKQIIVISDKQDHKSCGCKRARQYKVASEKFSLAGSDKDNDV